MANPEPSAGASSAAYAIAAAGTLPRARPINARVASRFGHENDSDVRNVRAEAVNRQVLICFLRSHKSDMKPVTKITTASVPVVIDSERLLATGPIPNSSEKIGMTGCTQYISENVPNPAAKRTTWARRSVLFDIGSCARLSSTPQRKFELPDGLCGPWLTCFSTDLEEVSNQVARPVRLASQCFDEFSSCRRQRKLRQVNQINIGFELHVGDRIQNEIRIIAIAYDGGHG